MTTFDGLDAMASHAKTVERRKYALGIDSTGSMDPLWAATQRTVPRVFDFIQQNSNVGFEMMLVSYKDNEFDSNPVIASPWYTDSLQVGDWINDIYCDGGGDFEESPELAILAADQLGADILILLGDAPGKSRRRAEDLDIAKTFAKRGKIFGLYVEQDKRTAKWFQDIAEATGGKAVFVQSLDHIEDTLKTIMKIDGILTVDYKPKTITALKLLEGY